MSDLEKRTEALEMRITYQDEAIEALNATITAQWTDIDALKRQVAALREQLAEAEAGGSAPRNEPPPHY